MKKLIALLALFCASAFGTTLSPIQLLNPSGSVAGQMIVSTGPSSAPAWQDVGSGTPRPGIFTTLSASSTISGVGFSSYFASPPTLGSTTPNSGAFTTLTTTGAATPASLSTSSATISGGAINSTPVGATTASTGAFTTLSASSTISGTGFTSYLASPPSIGATAPATGKFTTLQATGAITPSSTAGIVGTTTNDNANAGSVGEFVTNTTSGTSLTNGTAFNATSISLTAGDWDVSGVVQYNGGAGSTITSFQQGISTTSVTFGGLGSYTALQPTLSTSAPSIAQQVPVTRISVASTTTVYLIGYCSFSGGTATGNGYIRARRIR